ncbi:MAG: fibronectin type III domain-containing protein [bacterium]
MKTSHWLIAFVAPLVFVCAGCRTLAPAPAPPAPTSPWDQATSEVRKFIADNSGRGADKIFPPGTSLRDLQTSGGVVRARLSQQILLRPWRPDDVASLKQEFENRLPKPLPGPLAIEVGGRALEDTIGPFFRPDHTPRYGGRPASYPQPAAPLRRNISAAAPSPTHGLTDRNIVVWASHGWYYENRGDDRRWQWQRPRLFTSVEDMLPMSFFNPFLLPMLENAGAVVFSCRERDAQLHEVVVDNGDADATPERGTFSTSGAFAASPAKGFKNGLAPYTDGENPHQLGTTHQATAVKGTPTANARWTPNIPEDGQYAVYISYAASSQNAPDARYTVHHAGGSTIFLVNQQMAGNIWVYLGSFQFHKGHDTATGSLELTNNSSTPGAIISADAVKFGGGYGDIEREGQVSGYPRYAEGARYWFQYSGVDTSLVYAFRGMAGNEYNEDYVGRSEYGNYLLGAPDGPNPDRSFPGLGVPVDLSFAMHTDAGITTGVVGTLMIYRTADQERSDTFPDGRSRILNRDLGDIIQTQIVNDVRAKYTTGWTRRELRDGDYAESRRPNMPDVLLECLSHQNYDDMKFALDPRFRFDVARAIYKGMLRFLATEYGFEAVIEPLPPTHLAVRTIAPGRVKISWHAQADPLEPTANPTAYVIYRREGDGGFDNGTLIEGKTETEISGLDSDTIYSFRATAVNSGGESFPSEALAVRTGNTGEPRALIVNAFDRIAPPALVTGPQREGADRAEDRGVGYGWSTGLVGDQYNFPRNSREVSNDNIGHGASYADLETKQELGNTFDYTYRHGAAFAALGWAFDSASDESLTVESNILKEYKVVDWLLGEERTTMPPPAHDGKTSAGDKMKPDFAAWPPAHQQIVRDYLSGGGRLFVSGAYVATDLVISPLSTDSDKAFLKDVLQCQWVTNHASRTNDLVVSTTDTLFADLTSFHFSRDLGEDNVYGVELPDGLGALKGQGAPLLRYKDGDIGAAIASDQGGTRRVVLGFPFECITGEENRTALLRGILTYLTK